MTIDVLTNDGSPLGVVPSDVFGGNGRVGVGGAELALLTMCEAWAAEGHDVRLYNDPRLPSETFEQLPIDAFEPRAPRDQLIVFRSPNGRAEGAAGKKTWWSCDCETVGDFRAFSSLVDTIVVISDFHRRSLEAMYGIHDAVVIDLPVRTREYAAHPPRRKHTHQLLFSSVPSRGLGVVARVYPAIQREMPDVSLVITSDYRLWGGDEPHNAYHRQQLEPLPNVRFLGAVSRHQLIEEQLASDVLLYPSTYPELFCIAAAEAQVSGALPVTSATGALPTTNMGVVVDGDPHDPGWQRAYAAAVVSWLTSTRLMETQEDIRQRAVERFDIGTISRRWREQVFDGARP